MDNFNYQDHMGNGGLRLGKVMITPRMLEMLEDFQLRDGAATGIETIEMILRHLLNELAVIPSRDVDRCMRLVRMLQGCCHLLDALGKIRQDGGGRC